MIEGEDGLFLVGHTEKTAGGVYLHRGTIGKGLLCPGDKVTARVDRDSRWSTMRNHTAAHLLQAALRQVLGDHVQQAGQLVNNTRMRFDFTHFSAMTQEEIQKVEKLVNGWIFDGIPTLIREMPLRRRASWARWPFSVKSTATSCGW